MISVWGGISHLDIQMVDLYLFNPRWYNVGWIITIWRVIPLSTSSELLKLMCCFRLWSVPTISSIFLYTNATPVVIAFVDGCVSVGCFGFWVERKKRGPVCVCVSLSTTRLTTKCSTNWRHRVCSGRDVSVMPEATGGAFFVNFIIWKNGTNIIYRWLILLDTRRGDRPLLLLRANKPIADNQIKTHSWIIFRKFQDKNLVCIKLYDFLMNLERLVEQNLF